MKADVRPFQDWICFKAVVRDTCLVQVLLDPSQCRDVRHREGNVIYAGPERVKPVAGVLRRPEQADGVPPVSMRQ